MVKIIREVVKIIREMVKIVREGIKIVQEKEERIFLDLFNNFRFSSGGYRRGGGTKRWSILSTRVSKLSNLSARWSKW